MESCTSSVRFILTYSVTTILLLYIVFYMYSLYLRIILIFLRLFIFFFSVISAWIDNNDKINLPNEWLVSYNKIAMRFPVPMQM